MIRHLVVRAGYWLRPYDMTRDDRRWRWQKPAPCGFQVAASLPASAVEALVAALEEARSDEAFRERLATRTVEDRDILGRLGDD